jgi:hypothetical protein
LKLINPHLQISGETIGEVKTVADMHQRKAEMGKHADAFIALPGKDFVLEHFHIVFPTCSYVFVE